MSLQTYFPVEDQEASDWLYKQTQVQRALERDVRKQKRECMLYKELGDDEAFEQSVVKLKAKEARLRKYVGVMISFTGGKTGSRWLALTGKSVQKRWR